jgi:uncharacterized protein YdaU (DUF1376 family)
LLPNRKELTLLLLAIPSKGGLKSGNFMANKVDIWMPLYIADYLSSTSRLTTEQHGAYLLLIMDYWKSGAPPDNDLVLSQITKLSPTAWANARTMLQPFFEVVDGLWIQHRIESEMVKAKHNKQVNQKRGKAGAEARWNKNAPSIDEAYSEVCSADSTSPSPSHSPTPLSIPKTTIQTPVGVSDSVWQEFKSLRKAKKAPITQRAIDALTNEANKAGWTLEKALEECIVRGWQAFKADWVVKPNPADNIRLTVPPSNEPNLVLLKIKEDAKNAAPMPDFVRQFAKQVKGSV